MIFAQQIGTALLLVTLTLWLHCGGIAVLITWERRALAREIHKLSPVGSTILVVGLTARVIAIHGLEVLLWTCCYRWLCFSSWEWALYFSASSYSTVGSNVVLPPQWRLLGPIESFVAVLMCGVSVSFLVAIATRLVVLREERAAERLDSRPGGPTRQDA